MVKYSLPLEEGKFYHIYNQGNNGENLFYSDGNYAYFLQKLDFYISNFVDMYAFCLMPNHFHLLVRIKTLEELNEDAKEQILSRPVRFLKHNRSEEENESNTYSQFVSNQFRLFFMSYSKSINKQVGRTGSLFREIFNRKEITSLPYLQQVVVYIHRNPVHHGFETDFTNYCWSSYNRITEEKITKLKKKEVLDWFDNKENYRYVHNRDVEDDMVN